MHILIRKNAILFAVVTLFYSLFLIHAASGVGQYWDWSFPYYSENISNFFSRANSSWTPASTGTPLGYSSDYFLRLAISLFTFLSPELLLYCILVLAFSIGTFGIILIARRYVSLITSVVFGVTMFVNPLIFYKYTAGHIDYLVSLDIFIYLVYYMLYKYRPSIRSAVIVGLLFAFSGFQIQFLMISLLFIGIYFITNPSMWRLKDMLALLALPLLINLVWLSNFIFGGADISSISATAIKGSFKGTSFTDFLNIFNFTFSKATLISRFFPSIVLGLFSIVLLLPIGLLAYGKNGRGDKSKLTLAMFLCILIFLATGLFQLLPLGPITTFYPMFREVGHFAPVILFVSLLLSLRLLPKNRIVRDGVCLLMIIASFSSVMIFQMNSQSVSFDKVRQQFKEFHTFDLTHNDPQYRSLSYPFFDQYAFTDGPQKLDGKLPLSNAGHDSFSAYAKGVFVKTGVKPQDFKNSMQYKLLTTKDVDVLRPYSIRYLYDFSSIYETYYDRYVPGSTYDNDLSLIKSSKRFFDELLAANPNELRRVSPHILEVIHPAEKISISSNLFKTDTDITSISTLRFMQSLANSKNVAYMGNDANNVDHNVDLSVLFNDPESVSESSNSIQQKIIGIGGSTKIYKSSASTDIAYSIAKNKITLYGSNLHELKINNKTINDIGESKEIVSEKYDPNLRYFVEYGGKTTELSTHKQGEIGIYKPGTKLRLFTTSGVNIIDNGSFEKGYWQPKVTDCNKYDNKGAVSMSIDPGYATDGTRSLVLEAGNHVACTSTQFKVDAKSKYILSYDYQSKNALETSFFMNFNNSNKVFVKGSTQVTNDNWNSAFQQITIPSSAKVARLFISLKSESADSKTPMLHYDNFKLLKVYDTKTIRIPDTNPSFKNLKTSEQGKADLEITSPDDGFKNLLANGSFESGPWRSGVSDCNNYDNHANISMQIDTTTSSDGRQSIKLNSQHHSACSYNEAIVKPFETYKLTLDYLTSTGTNASVMLKFDDERNSIKQFDLAQSNKWNKFSTYIDSPEGASIVKIFIITNEGNSRLSSVNFDNVRMIMMPTVLNTYFGVSGKVNLDSSTHINTRIISREKTNLTIENIKAPVYLLFSESYHPGWQLKAIGKKQAQSLNSYSIAKNHFNYNDYGNGWLIKPKNICAEYTSSCTLNKDGSFDIKMSIEFAPQHWFRINKSISIITILVSVLYLTVSYRNHKTFVFINKKSRISQHVR